MVNLLKYFFSNILFIFINIIQVFVIFRFGFVYTRLGHLCFNIDHYISNRSNKKEITILGFTKPVSNNFIFFNWKKVKKIFFSNLFNFFYSYLLENKKNSKFLIKSKELHPYFSKTSSYKRVFPVIKYNQEKINRFLKKNNINKNFVCIHNRDDLYLKKNTILNDLNNHSFRNYKISDLVPAINYLLSKKISVIRLGSCNEKKLNIEKKGFIDFSNEELSHEIQLYLIENCIFFIGCNSGFSAISRLFRKPILLINYIPFDIIEMTAWSSNSLILVKKIINPKTKKILNFFELTQISKNHNIHTLGNFLDKEKLLIKNNSKLEIKNSVIEMNLRVQNKWKDNLNQKKLQKHFFKKLLEKKNYINFIKNKTQIRISSTFLQNNKNLF